MPFCFCLPLGFRRDFDVCASLLPPRSPRAQQRRKQLRRLRPEEVKALEEAGVELDLADYQRQVEEREEQRRQQRQERLDREALLTLEAMEREEQEAAAAAARAQQGEEAPGGGRRRRRRKCPWRGGV